MQVGDPFTEKLLLEACLEVMATGAVVGIQDMGAAGPGLLHLGDAGAQRHRAWTSSFARARSARTGMTPYELLLSESQERMLLVAARGREEEVQPRLRASGSSTPSRSAR